MAQLYDPLENDLDNIVNFRDVGQTVNRFLGRKVVREGVLFRSARPDEASKTDRQKLKNEYGITTIIDLRTKTEHLRQAEKRNAAPATPSLLSSNDAVAEPLQIPGINYLEIKVTGGAFERFLLSQLSWWSYLKVIVFFLCGYRQDAIHIMSREVMIPRGLIGLGLATIDNAGDEIARALHSLLQPGNLPLLIHCTHGKDRTGSIVTLVLLILGVPLSAINFDYHLTDEAQARDAIGHAQRLKEIRSLGLPDEWEATVPGMNEAFVAHLEKTYGGTDAYFDSIGFDEGCRRKLRELLLY